MARRPIDAPLRSDVRLLGELLGVALSERDGRRLFDLEERVRALSKQRRQQGPGAAKAEAALTRLLRTLSARDAETIIRAFTHYFALVNSAEQHHRVRRARAHARDRRPQPGSLTDCLRQTQRAGIGAAEVRAALRSLIVTLTFTAHPSQVVRRTILDRMQHVAEVLEHRDRCEGTPLEAAEALRQLTLDVTVLWLTDPLGRERPRVADEVKTVEWYAEGVLALAARQLSTRVSVAFEAVYHEPLGFLPSILRLHAWPGGDMDGNPEVTPEVFEDALRAYRARGIARLLEEVRALGGLLSHSERYASIPDELARSLDRDGERLPGFLSEHGPRTEGEPFRRKLRFLEHRLASTLAAVEQQREAAFPGLHRAARQREMVDPNAHIGARELEAELALLAGSLLRASGPQGGARRVEDLLEEVRGQGLDLAELEMRAHAAEVRSAADGGDARVLGALRRLAMFRQGGDGGGCRTLILSMASTGADLLAAVRCARVAGLWDDKRGCARLDVVPLFETLEALQSSATVMHEALADPVYSRHVRARGGQEVMLGYSDSSKEVGLLAASAALRKAQAGLRRLSDELRLPLWFFHGRGETVARGGGPAQGAILALPPGSVAGRFKVTEQGEALDHKYSRPEIALRTLELYAGGALLHTLGVLDRPAPKEEARYEAFFAELGGLGREAYRSLVWDEPRFVEFFEAATPVRELSELKIGSRPSKRTAGGLEALRAIPWVFAWNQNRATLPGWFGVGSAFEEASRRKGGERLLRAMHRSWPFFRALVANVEMVLAKTDLHIASHYAALAPAEIRQAIWPRIVDEHARTLRWVLRLTGSKRLLDSNPSLQRSIDLRNPYVDPLSLLQVELLRRKRAGDERCDRPLLLTVGGIAAGMRNTG